MLERPPSDKKQPIELQERYRLLAEAVSTVRDYAIFMLDPNGYILTWNAGAERFKGYLRDEILGRHFSIFYTPSDIARKHPQAELEIATREGRFEEEGWRVRKDGTQFWANVVITAYRDSNGTLLGFMKVTRDLTERKRAEEKLKSANESLELRVQDRTEELSLAKDELEKAIFSRDEFLSVASHELKTPITSLKLQAQMLRSRVNPETGKMPTPEKMLQSLDIIIRQTNRLTGLIEDLLDASRVQIGKFNFAFEKTDLSDLVVKISGQWDEPLRSVGCTLTTDIEPKIIVRVDSYRFEQVIVNLLSNAMKYAPSSPVKITLTSHEKRAFLTVSDSGPGIPASSQDKIFERYERMGGYGVSGLGLGLFISKIIVEAHGGTIRVDSKPGEGSSFVVILPTSS